MSERPRLPRDVADDLMDLARYLSKAKLLNMNEFLGEKNRPIIPDIYPGGKIAHFIFSDVEKNLPIYCEAVLHGFYIAEDSPMNHLKKGDKLRRLSDGKLFTYLCSDDSDDENYAHVEEMLVPVYLPDFEKEESE